jgi:hypothetical protein
MISKKYVPEDTIVICNQGTMTQKIKVWTQDTTDTGRRRLLATENDRWSNNFYCIKMTQAGAIVGAIVCAILAAVVGIKTKSKWAAKLTLAACTVEGALMGRMMSKIPGICPFLCYPSPWSSVHPRVFIEGQKALLSDAKVNCILGGEVSITMIDFKMTVDMAMLSKHVYGNGDPLPKGWEMADPEDFGLSEEDFTDDRSGFNSKLYKGPDGKYALIFEGTNPDMFSKEGLKDWWTNIQQGLGKETEQYTRAMKLSEKVAENVGADNLTLGGHSLGGGLASAGAAATGCETYTYNPAGLHPKTVERAGYSMENTSHVQAFYSKNDMLNSYVQNNREIIGGAVGAIAPKMGGSIVFGDDLPRAAGQKMGIDTGIDCDPITGHGIGEGESGLLEALKEQKDNLSPSGMVKIYADKS